MLIQTCECSNNNLTCQTGFKNGCWYCSYCFSNNKTCSFYGDIECNGLQSNLGYQAKMPIWAWFFILFCIFSFCIIIPFFLKLLKHKCCHLCSLNIIQIDQSLQQNNNNNHNNLPTISLDLQVNQIDQSLQQNNNNSPKCSICLENLNNNNKKIRTISCGHTFHQNCIDSWFNERPINPSCPFRCQLF
jgi:hypothetical protein